MSSSGDGDGGSPRDYSLRVNVIFFSGIFVCLHLLYAGVLKPAGHIFRICYEKFRSRSDGPSSEAKISPSRVLPVYRLQAICFFFLSCFTFLVVYFSWLNANSGSPLESLLDWIERNSFSSGEFTSSYIIYFLSLNWDVFILLMFIILVRWKRPNECNETCSPGKGGFSASLDEKQARIIQVDAKKILRSIDKMSSCNLDSHTGIENPQATASTPSAERRNSEESFRFKGLRNGSSKSFQSSPMLRKQNTGIKKRKSFYGNTVLLGSVLKRAESYCDVAGVKLSDIGSEIKSGYDNVNEAAEKQLGKDILGEKAAFSGDGLKVIKRSKTFHNSSENKKEWKASDSRVENLSLSRTQSVKEGNLRIEIEKSLQTPSLYGNWLSSLSNPSPCDLQRSPSLSLSGNSSTLYETPYMTASDHVYIIACHNSSDRVQNTINHILKHAEPWQIFVADNGSSAEQMTKTRRCCAECSMKYEEAHPLYGGDVINFGTISEGSKTIAQFATAFNIYRKWYLQEDNSPIEMKKNKKCPLCEKSSVGKASMSTFISEDCDRQSFNIEEAEGDICDLCMCGARPKYVTLLDDDTLLPANWDEEELSSIFLSNDRIKCIAYALRSSDTSRALPALEDLEYLISGFVKLSQAEIFGTTIFASGACNTWKLDFIVDILFRHDTMHHGDDLQQGLLLHSFKGREWVVNPIEDFCDGLSVHTSIEAGNDSMQNTSKVDEDIVIEMDTTWSSGCSNESQNPRALAKLSKKRFHSGGYQIRVSHSVVVPTDVPRCWIHLVDIIPPFLMNCLKSSRIEVEERATEESCDKKSGSCVSNLLLSACSCGEPSLFRQRAKGWDVSRQRFFWKYIKAIFHVGKGGSNWYWSSFWARVIAFHDLILIINDWVSIVYGILFLVLAESKMLFLFNIFVTWAFQLFVFDTLNVLILTRAGLGVASEVVTLFPLLYKLPTILFIRLFGMLYNILYYYPCNRTKTKVLKRFKGNNDFKTMVQDVWELDDISDGEICDPTKPGKTTEEEPKFSS